MLSKRPSWLAAVIGAALLSCAAPVREARFYDRMLVSSMGTVAVLPLENMTDNPVAADVVADMLATSLYKTKRFNKLIERGEVVRRLGKDIPDNIDRTAARDLGRKLRVDGVLTGTVSEYGVLLDRTTYRQDSVIGVKLELIDTHSGNVVWSGLINRSTGDAFFSNGQALTDLAAATTRDLIADLVPPTPAAEGGADASAEGAQ